MTGSNLCITFVVVGWHPSVIGRFANSEQQTSREDVYMADSLVSQVEAQRRDSVPSSMLKILVRELSCAFRSFLWWEGKDSGSR